MDMLHIRWSWADSHDVLRARVDRERLIPAYVLDVINSSHGQAYFRSKAKRTTNLASINSKEVAGLPVPELSPVRQQDVLNDLSAQVHAADAKRAAAATLRQSAWTAFEAALFTAAEACRPSTPSGSPRRASSLRSAASATPATTRRPRRSSGCSGPRRSITAGLGARWTPSSMPASNGSTGSTTGACWNPSASYLPAELEMQHLRQCSESAMPA